MSLLCIPGIVLTLFLNTWTIIIGKFIYGTAASCIIVASSLYLNETIPVEKSATFDFTINFGVILGITINLVLGLGLPTDDEGKMEDHFYWRFILAFPLLFIIIQLPLWLLVFKRDSLKQCFLKKNFEDARKTLSLIYDIDLANTSTDTIFDHHHEAFDKSQAADKGPRPGYIAVLCDSKYCIATWFVMTLAFFNQFSGVNCITIYSSDLFSQIGLNPTVGSALVGIF